MIERDFFTTWAPRLLGVLRIVAALLFLQHGTAKFFGFPYVEYLAGTPVLSLWGIAGVLEVAGGILLALGLFTRPVAFVLSGEMAFAYFLEHIEVSFFPLLNQGESAVLYCFLFLYLAAAGGGPWSLDALLRRRRLTG
jgi:putative oxidoreductase